MSTAADHCVTVQLDKYCITMTMTTTINRHYYYPGT